MESNEPEELKRMFNHFGNKPFLKFQAQGFQQYVISNAYKLEEEAFSKTVKVIPKSDVPENSNIIKSHTLYKVKINNDASMKLKALIAPHGNKDSMKGQLSSDCTTCSPPGRRILESIASFMGWKVTSVETKSAFLQTGKPEKDVYVIPPIESEMRTTHL